MVLPTVATFTSVIQTFLPEPHAGLLSGISFGTKATLSRQLTDALIATGTLHVVALSGMNISILSGFVSKLLLPVFGRRIASLLTVAIIIGFVWFVGPTASVVRAAIMGCLSLFAVFTGKQYWPILGWTVAVAIMIASHPLWISDLGFELSALATLGIIVFSRTESKSSLNHAGNSGRSVDGKERGSLGYTIRFFVSQIWRIVESDLQITLAAQVFTIPLLFFTFGRISFISPLANILIGWTIAPLTILGWAVAFFGWIWYPLGVLFAWSAWSLAAYFQTVIINSAAIPFASIGW